RITRWGRPTAAAASSAGVDTVQYPAPTDTRPGTRSVRGRLGEWVFGAWWRPTQSSTGPVGEHSITQPLLWWRDVPHSGNSGCSPKWRRCINIRPGRLPAGPVTGTAMQRATWRAPYHRAHLAGRPVRSAAPGAHQLGPPGRGGSVLSACLPRGAEDEAKLAEVQGQR